MVTQPLVDLEPFKTLGPGHPLLFLVLVLEVIDSEFLWKVLNLLLQGELFEEKVEPLSSLEVAGAAGRPDQSPQEYWLDD